MIWQSWVALREVWVGVEATGRMGFWSGATSDGVFDSWPQVLVASIRLSPPFLFFAVFCFLFSLLYHTRLRAPLFVFFSFVLFSMSAPFLFFSFFFFFLLSLGFGFKVSPWQAATPSLHRGSQITLATMLTWREVIGSSGAKRTDGFPRPKHQCIWKSLEAQCQCFSLLRLTQQKELAQKKNDF